MTAASLLLAGAVLGVLLDRLVRRLTAPRDPRACRISEETGGYFIGRKHCHAHNVVWDDGGRCPRQGDEPGDPFAFARDLGTGRS